MLFIIFKLGLKCTQYNTYYLNHLHMYSSAALGHVAVLPSPYHPAPELCSSCETGILDQLNSASHCPLPSAPGKHHSTFHSYDFDGTKYLILVESCSISLFVTGFFYLTYKTCRFIRVAVYIRIPSFLKLSIIPLCGYTTFCLPIHLLMDTWVASVFWLL